MTHVDPSDRYKFAILKTEEPTWRHVEMFRVVVQNIYLEIFQ